MLVADADRQPRAARYRVALRARARRRRRRRHPRVRLPRSGARRYRTSRATCCPAGLSAAEIDAAVRERTERGEAIYELDAERLHDLEPDLIVTQELCPVCAVSFDDVRAVAETIPSRPQVVALDPHTLGRVLRRRAHHRPAHRLARGRARPHRPPARADRRRARRGAQGRAGAGGGHRVVRPGLHRRPLDAADRRPRRRASTCSASPASTPSRAPGTPSPPRRRAWWSPCPAATTPSARTRRPAPTPTRCATVGAERVVAVDASAYFSRPGPRLVDGLELMAHILHPDLVPEPAGAALEVEV